MSTPNRARRMTETCTITRNPSAGNTGITTVATDLPCTPAYPVDETAMRMWELATTARMFEISAADSPGVRDGDLVALDGKTYLIKGRQRWPVRPRRAALLHLVMELQT